MRLKTREHQKNNFYIMNKKIILSLALASIVLVCFASSLTLVSCQDKTKEKLENAKDAFTKEVKETIDSAKIKAETKFDSVKEKAKSRMDSVKIKSAEKLEEAAEKLKESVKK